MTARITAFARRTRRAVRLYGIGGAVRQAARAARRLATPTGVDPFDRRFGVDTAGIVRLEGRRVRGGNRDLGHRYQTSRPEAVREVLGRLPIRVEDFALVDIGSGKGRVVLIAAGMPFKRVVGVEFCEELDAIARTNLAAFPAQVRACHDVTLVCLDAAEFELPADPLVLYFYNPFLEPVMRAVMANVVASVERRPRPVFVVLTGDRALAPVVLDAGFTETADGVFTR